MQPGKKIKTKKTLIVKRKMSFTLVNSKLQQTYVKTETGSRKKDVRKVWVLEHSRNVHKPGRRSLTPSYSEAQLPHL